jgi:hypothetical protein
MCLDYILLLQLRAETAILSDQLAAVVIDGKGMQIETSRELHWMSAAFMSITLAAAYMRVGRLSCTGNSDEGLLQSHSFFI